MTPSQLLFLNSITPSSTFSLIGLPVKFEKVDNFLKFFFKFEMTFFVIVKPIKFLSVTNNGLLIFKFLHAKGKSSILFSPTHTVVG